MKDIKDMSTEELEREMLRIEARQAELRMQLRVARFNKYPKAAQKIMRSIGWAPEDTDKVIVRTTGSFKAER